MRGRCVLSNLCFLSALRGVMALVATDGAQLSMVGEGAVAPVVMIAGLAVATGDSLGCWVSKMTC